MRILAIDPAIRNTGYAVVEGDYRRARALDYGTLSIPRSVSQSGCLLAIKQHLGNLIDKWNPDEMAVERIIYVQSHQTAITMGAAKAAVVIAAAEAGLRIMEYSPKSVKGAGPLKKRRSPSWCGLFWNSGKRRNPMPPTLWRSASPTSFLRTL